MKKINQLIILFVSVFMIMNPIVVKADMLQLHSDAYSRYVSVGSEFIYAIKVGQNSFDGIVTFDNSVLEVLKVETVYSGSSDVYAGKLGTVSNSVNGNQLSINYITGDLEENILVTFKVKSYPSDGTTTVKVKANTNNWFGEPYATMNIIKPSECPTCEKEEISCPECEKCEVTVDSKKDATSKDNKEMTGKDILLYSSLGVCGVLAIALVVLAFRKK